MSTTAPAAPFVTLPKDGPWSITQDELLAVYHGPDHWDSRTAAQLLGYAGESIVSCVETSGEKLGKLWPLVKAMRAAAATQLKAAQLRAAQEQITTLRATERDLVETIRIQTADLLDAGAPVQKLETYIGDLRTVRADLDRMTSAVEWLRDPPSWLPQAPAGVAIAIASLGVNAIA